MQYPYEQAVRDRLLERQLLLRQAGANGNSVKGLETLIRQVDVALHHLDHGSAGICRVCHEPVETERLEIDPLVDVCLECMTDEEKQALEQDLRMAARIQSSLLPEPSLQIGPWEIGHTYEPLGLVSGDYCDVLFSGRQDDSVFFLLGDVSGKGVAASMAMAQLHATFRSLIPFGLPLKTLVSKVNRLFTDSTLAAMFATLVIGRLDSSGVVELCNAGHNPPLLVQTERITPLHATGMPLGLFSNGAFGTKSFQLERDDMLFLYTDGLTEARGPSGDEFGLERIISNLPSLRGERAAMVAGESAQLVSEFRGLTPREDDTTIMAIRYHDSDLSIGN